MDTFAKPTLLPKFRPNTNERYHNFNQSFFTAGDKEQFMSHRNEIFFENQTKISGPPAAEKWSFDIAPLFEQPGPKTVEHTFDYIFFKFKKGIFVQIRDGALKVFLPFSNAHFVNEWGDKVTAPPELLARPDVAPLSHWYNNNYLVRYELPGAESDLGHVQLKHMLTRLCAARAVPDIEFFINKRDFPLLKRDKTEPYDAVYGAQTPLASHNYETYAPILSMVEHDAFADFAMPTVEDWTRVCARAGTFFAGTKRMLNVFQDDFPTPWAEKKSAPVFRGSNTGAGHTPETNLRAKLCLIAAKLGDIGLSAINERAHIVDGKVLFPNRAEFSPLVRPFLSLKEQSEYKYIIHVAGHVQAFRLGAELATGSVLLLVESPYRLWYEQKLVAWEHYIPVAADLSNLAARIKWCQLHDPECEIMAQNARAFYDEWLATETGILDYMATLLYTLRNEAIPFLPLYPHISFLSFVEREELQSIQAIGARAPIQFKGRARQTSRCFLNIQRTWPRAQEVPRALYQNKNTVLKKIGPHHVVKRTRRAALVHEAAIGLHCVNELLRAIPNFIYTYEYHSSDNSLLLEYLPSITLHDYLRGNRFIFDDWLFTMKQLALALRVAQRTCFFTHHDACPWNILLMMSRPKIIDYIVDAEVVFRVNTSLVPILIDYGRSFAVKDSQLFQASDEFSPFQDVVCLVISSVFYILTYQTLRAEQEARLIALVNQVFSGAAPTFFSEISTRAELLAFVSREKKFSRITFAQKGDSFMAKSPMALFQAIDLSACAAGSIEATAHAEYFHLGALERPRAANTADIIPSLFRRYADQQLWILGAAPADAGPTPLGDDWTFQRRTEIANIVEWRTDPLYLEVINMIEELLVVGGPHQLTREERARVRAALRDFLGLRAQILAQIIASAHFKYNTVK